MSQVTCYCDETLTSLLSFGMGGGRVVGKAQLAADLSVELFHLFNLVLELQARILLDFKLLFELANVGLRSSSRALRLSANNGHSFPNHKSRKFKSELHRGVSKLQRTVYLHGVARNLITLLSLHILSVVLLDGSLTLVLAFSTVEHRVFLSLMSIHLIVLVASERALDIIEFS